MDWHRFEDWTCDQIRSSGLTVSKTPRVGDGGADVIVRVSSDSGRGAFIQVKHRSRGKTGVVSENEVLDVLRARDRYPVQCPLFFLVTNGSVDHKGLRVAEANAIRIVDHSKVADLAMIVRNSIR